MGDRYEEAWADWRRRHRDPRSECAEVFCFQWDENSAEGGVARPGGHVRRGGCSVGQFHPGLGCRRIGDGEGDLFEPCEPFLVRAGLPEDGSTFRDWSDQEE